MEIRFRNFHFKIPFPLLLLPVALIAFWQLAFLQNGLEWDIQDSMLPWRYHAGECLQNGIFPLWDPYQQFGFPIHADLQYTNWNPEVWLVGNLFGYSLYTLYVLIFFYVWMAGVGMYKLANFFNADKRTAFFLACCYMLSGCVVAHMQQFVVIIGMAWLPFVCWQFFDLIENLKWKNVFGLSLFFYLLMSSGYQALAFMLVYFFAAVIIYKIAVWIKEKERKKIISFCVKGGITIVLLAVLLLPVFISVHQSASYVNRLDKGVSLGEAQTAPFSPQSLVSVLFPAATAKNASWIKTDLSCANIFFGFVPFFLFIFSIFSKKNGLQKIIFGFSLVFLLASFGDYLPVRKFLFNFVPLMNLFRLPGLFRIVVLLLVLIQLSIYLKEEINFLGKLKFIFSGSALIYLTAAVVSFILMRKEELVLGKITEDVFNSFQAASLWELLFYQSLFFFLLALAGTIFIFWKKEKWKWQTVSFVTLISLIIGTQFNIYFDIASENPPSFIQSWIKKMPKGYPLPPETAPADYSRYESYAGNICANGGNFLKKQMFDEYSSYRFNASENLTDDFPQIKKQLLFYPCAYLSDTVAVMNDLRNFKATDTIKKMITFLTDENRLLKFTPFSVSKSDSLTCTMFRPDRIEYDVSVSKKAIFNLMQADYEGWSVTDSSQNKIPVKIIRNAGLCMSLILEKGKHHLKFQYRNEIFMKCYWFSLSCFCLCCLLFSFFQRGWIRISGFIFFIGISVLTVWKFRSRTPNDFRAGTTMEKVKIVGLNKSNCIAENICERADQKDRSDAEFFRADNSTERTRIFKMIQNASGEKFGYAWYGKNPDKQIIEYILHYFPVKEKEILNKNFNSGLLIFSNGGMRSDFQNVYEYTDANDSLNWVGQDNTVIPFSKSRGKNSAEIDAANNGSPVFTAAAGKLFTEGVKALRFSFRIKSPCFFDHDVRAFIRLNGVKKFEKIFYVKPYFVDTYDWNYVSFRIEPDITVRPEMNVNIILTNRSGDVIEVKDVRVETLLE